VLLYTYKLGVGVRGREGNIMPPSFQFNSKRIFLTYPQVGELPHGTVLAKLDELECVQRILGIERHSDGGIHYHVLAEWATAFRTRDPRTFDVDGHHHNISGVRDVHAVYNYVTKDGDVHGEFALRSKKRSGDDVFGEACASTSSEQFLGIIREGKPRDFVIYHDRLEAFAKKKWKEEPEEYTSPENSKPFVLPDDLAGWVENEFPKVLYPFTLSYNLIL